MSSGLIVLIFIVALILIVGYVVAVILRKRNEALLAALEERKEKLYNLPVNDEVEAVKNMHLIGQSQIAFREWNQKWVDLSLNSFADIENNLFEAEGYNNSFRFMKAKQAIDNIESQIQLIDEDIKAIRKALSDLEEQEQKNSGRVVHALDMFEELQKEVTSDPDRYGSALPEIEKQIGNIQSEFSQFVTLNSSGDPVEAAEILDDQRLDFSLPNIGKQSLKLRAVRVGSGPAVIHIGICQMKIRVLRYIVPADLNLTFDGIAIIILFAVFNRESGVDGRLPDGRQHGADRFLRLLLL